MNKFSERGKITASELAFARIAIIKDAIKRLQPHNKATQMSTGVDQYMAKVFAKQEHATTAMIAIQLYEQNVSHLAELANVLVRRLSFSSGVSEVEIAPLLEGAVAEAEALMRASSSFDKLSETLKRR
jgi:hypothetical protein